MAGFSLVKLPTAGHQCTIRMNCQHGLGNGLVPSGYLSHCWFRCIATPQWVQINGRENVPYFNSRDWCPESAPTKHTHSIHVSTFVASSSVNNRLCNIERSGRLICNLSYLPEIILRMRPATEKRRYIATLFLIGWVHPQHEPGL